MHGSFYTFLLSFHFPTIHSTHDTSRNMQPSLLSHDNILHSNCNHLILTSFFYLQFPTTKSNSTWTSTLNYFKNSKYIVTYSLVSYLAFNYFIYFLYQLYPYHPSVCCTHLPFFTFLSLPHHPPSPFPRYQNWFLPVNSVNPPLSWPPSKTILHTHNPFLSITSF